MPSEVPDPLVDADTDLTDFKFMPLEVSRLLGSEWWIVACSEDPRRAMAAINLWARSWHQRPAGSLPSNDVVLASLAMVPLLVWREIRDAVMEPWVLCSDGRWYHPVVSEKVREAWEDKLAYRKRKAEWQENGRKGQQKRGEKAKIEATLPATLPDPLPATLTDPLPATLTDPLPPKEERDSGKGKGKGECKGKGLTYLKEEELSAKADALAPPDPKISGEGYSAEFEAWWSIYPRKEGKGAAFRAFSAAKKLVDVDRLTQGAKAYSQRVKGEEQRFIKQGATWLNQHCWNDEAPPEKPKSKHWFPGYVPMAANGG
jgi:hypothetical protein